MSRKPAAALEECWDLICKMATAAFLLSLLGGNTLLAAYFVLQNNNSFAPILLASDVFLIIAPVLPCIGLFVSRFVTQQHTLALHICSFIGATCWYVWVLLSGETWFLPALVVLNHYVFPHNIAAAWLLSIVTLFASLVLYTSDTMHYHQHETGGVVFAQELALSFILLFGSLTVQTPQLQQPLLLSSRAKRNAAAAAATQQQFFTLSLDDMNTAEALEEISAAKRNRPGVWERVDYLKLGEDVTESLQINDQIGVGSFGNIYRASIAGSVVALKRIKTVTREFVENMLNEVDILSDTHHPNIIQLLGWCDHPYVLVCFEFANGGSLHDFLLRSQLPVGWCAVKTKMAMDAASALAFLHNRDILHRDVKSENLLVFCNGNSLSVKLGDFGCAVRRKCDDGGEAHDEAVTTTKVGSTLWHAPEILEHDDICSSGGVEFTFATDVWAFGTTLCEIVTHVTPWEDLLTGESLFVKNSSPAEQLRPIASQFSNIHVFERIVALVDRCCCLLEHGDRPSMNTVLFDLMQLYVAGDGDDENQDLYKLSPISHAAEDPFHALSVTQVEISPQYSPVFFDPKRRSDPLSGGYAGGKRRIRTRSSFASPVRPVTFVEPPAAAAATPPSMKSVKF